MHSVGSVTFCIASGIVLDSCWTSVPGLTGKHGSGPIVPRHPEQALKYILVVSVAKSDVKFMVNQTQCTLFGCIHTILHPQGLRKYNDVDSCPQNTRHIVIPPENQTDIADNELDYVVNHILQQKKIMCLEK